MSMGSWLLAAYGPVAGVAAASAVTGLLPGVGRAATAGAAVLGPAVSTYTAVLVADTAVPAWHDAYPEMPFVFAGSSATAAAGLGMLAAPVRQTRPARVMGVFGAALELAASQRLERRLGMVAEPYRTGKAGALMRVAQGLTVAGVLGGALLGGRSRVVAAVSGAALLASSACTRFAIFQAGMASAKDPKYPVGPQRERLESGERAQLVG
jgi:hypothetical protein